MYCDAHVIQGGLDDKIRAANTDGGNRGIQPEAIAGGVAPASGDGAHYAFVEPELDGTGLSGWRGLAG